eukprot:TRINITY_DN6517_c0_g1_i8.p1 TRINITY_DN6517_c0_g1~~TRINITY_DN6517_c0_g1_i8.p1  ORF type:complete len:544 (+),score=136.86 TRINITY_DN6517_c0_g1_i8:127-1758(+)
MCIRDRLTHCVERAELFDQVPELLELSHHSLRQCCLFATTDALKMATWQLPSSSPITGKLTPSPAKLQNPPAAENDHDNPRSAFGVQVELSNVNSGMPTQGQLHVSARHQDRLLTFEISLELEDQNNESWDGRLELTDRAVPDMILQPTNSGADELCFRSDTPRTRDAFEFLTSHNILGITQRAAALQLKCALPYVAGMASAALQARPPTSLLQAFKAGFLTDMVVVAEGHEFNVHRVVLVARSPYFAAMCSGGMQEAEQRRVELAGWSRSVVAAILEWMYAACVTIHSDDLVALLLATDLLQASSLHAQCLRVLMEQLSPENACTLAGIAEMLGSDSGDKLYQAAMGCVDEHMEEVQQTQAFNDLPDDSRITRHIQAARGSFFINPSRSARHVAARRKHRSRSGSPTPRPQPPAAVAFGCAAQAGSLFGTEPPGPNCFGNLAGGPGFSFGQAGTSPSQFTFKEQEPGGQNFSFGNYTLAGRPGPTEPFMFGSPPVAGAATNLFGELGQAGGELGQAGGDGEAGQGEAVQGLARIRSMNEEEV